MIRIDDASKCFNILIDAREFRAGKMTGIGRVLKGLGHSILCENWIHKITMGGFTRNNLPKDLIDHHRLNFQRLNDSFFISEFQLSRLSQKNFSLYISPYPKLPLFGTGCPSIHIIHDVLDLTSYFYRRRVKRFFDLIRLKRAIKKASLTWYDSNWSMLETEKLVGCVGRNPKVRHLGIESRYRSTKTVGDEKVLRRYDLRKGYILCIGNGLPHKNLSVLLEIARQLKRPLVFVGVSEINRLYWSNFDRDERTQWIQYVEENDLPAIYRGAFCLAQPSTAEGYGYPPLEAMACGTPAVVSNIPVLVETTGGNALSADPENPGNWVDAIGALEGSELRQNLIEKGLAWVEPMKGSRGWRNHLSDIRELIDFNEIQNNQHSSAC